MIHELYQGAVKLEFDEGRHQYRVNGSLVPSVTGILQVLAKPALVPWAAKMCGEYLEANLPVGQPLDEIQKARLIKEMKGAHKRKSEDAADIGTIVHKFAEDYVQGKDPSLPINPQAKSAAESFLDWMSQHHVRVLHSERRIFSRVHFYAGTVDLIAEVDDVLTIADFKTSSGIYPEMFLQLAAYSIAHEEESHNIAERNVVLRFPKDGGTVQAGDGGDLAALMKNQRGFLAALNLFRWTKGVAA